MTGLTSPRLLGRALSRAIENGNLEFCQNLIRGDVDINLSMGDCAKCTPVLHALAYKQWDIASLLLDKGGSAQGTSCITEGWSALHYCAAHGQIDLLYRIVRKEPHILSYDVPVPLLHVAAANDHLEILELLLTGSIDLIKPFLVDTPLKSTLTEEILFNTLESSDLGQGTTALHAACFAGNLKSATLLLENGASVNATNADWSTPLHHAVLSGNVDVVKHLISKGANIDAQDWLTRTPAMTCALMGDYRTLEVLAELGANLELRDGLGDQLLHFAAEFGHASIVAYLWSRGHCLESVEANGFDACLLGFRSRDPTLRTFLLNCGADISCCSPNGYNAIHAELSCLIQVKKIVRRVGAPQVLELINCKPPHGASPLYLAAANGNVPVVKFLLDTGGNADAEGGPEGTPLMGATQAGRLEVVRVLLNAGASIICQRGPAMLSAVQTAEHHPEVVRWLLVERFTERRLLCM